MTPQTKSEVFTCAEAASVSLWALVTHALRADGKDAALVAMDKVAGGKAHIDCQVIFTKRGVMLEGKFCSHGTASHLFSVTLNQPGDTDPPPATDPLH